MIIRIIVRAMATVTIERPQDIASPSLVRSLVIEFVHILVPLSCPREQVYLTCWAEIQFWAGLLVTRIAIL